MPLHLITFSEAPPYLRYTVPETGKTVPESHLSVHNYYDLRDAVIQHYKANGLSVPGGLDQSIQDQLCQRIPERFCADEHGQRRGGSGFGFDFSTVLQGTRTLVDWFVSGRERVDDDEVVRRATICSSCPNNQEPSGCTACNMPALMGLVNQVVGGKDLAVDGALKSCVVCGCHLRAKTRLPLAALRKHTSETQLSRFPSHCWMKDSL